MTMRSESAENYVRLLHQFEENISGRIVSDDKYGYEIKAGVKVTRQKSNHKRPRSMKSHEQLKDIKML